MSKYRVRAAGHSATPSPSPHKRDHLPPPIPSYKMSEDLFKPFPNSTQREVLWKLERLTESPDVVISFISDPPGTNFYSSRFRTLINRIEAMGYDYVFYQYVCDRNYFQNCCFKPYFIQSRLRELGKNILWVDGDSFIKSNLNQIMTKTKTFDLGLVSYTSSMDSFVASPIYFVNNPLTHSIVDAWEKHCTSRVEHGKCELDHDALKHQILPYFRDQVKIHLSGIDYHKGEHIENVNSDVPHKREILLQMREVNKERPFPTNVTNYNLV